jgi:hypothetical protein
MACPAAPACGHSDPPGPWKPRGQRMQHGHGRPAVICKTSPGGRTFIATAETIAITQGHLLHNAESSPAAPIADYLLVPPRVGARVPARRTASYGHHVADRLQGTCSLCRSAAVRLGLSEAGPQSGWTVDGVWLARCLHRRFLDRYTG